ncbi:MAG: phospholipid/cholesterol/gamma-HCH transport system substrate-binding protein [Flavobacteriales bacterium]
MKISKEFSIGLIVLLTIAVAIYGINYLKGADIFDTQSNYYAVYNNIDGLEKGNPVTLNGFQIGMVKNIQIPASNQQQLLVTIVVSESNLKIPKDSKAVIISSDFLGSKAVDLMLGDSLAFVIPGDTLNGQLEAGLKESVNKELAPLKRKAENLISSVDNAIQVVQSVFNKDAQKDLSEGVVSIKNAFKSLERASAGVDSLVAKQSQSVSKTIKQIEKFTKMLETNSSKIDVAIGNIKTISDSLAASNLTQAINSAEKAMTDVSQIMIKVNEGSGTVGRMINDDSLYVNMLEATKNLEYLLEDMRVHPNRYVHFSVFGVRNKGSVMTREQERKVDKLLKKK